MSNYDEMFVPLSSRVNFTDPIVRHDPQVEKSCVVKFNATEKIKSSGNGINLSGGESKNIEGPKIPVIRINNRVMDRNSIGYVYIDYNGFTPTAKVVILQSQKSEELLESAGMNSNMTIVMTPSVDGAYKPISIDFYIYKVKYESEYVEYWGKYRMQELQQPMTKQITFNPFPTPGCNAKYCKLGPNKYPTTYEFLHYIAVSECGLGFAATDNVKEIKDDKTRLLRNETYYDAIQKHVAFGGLDENSVFDCWIDLYRYLVVVNYSWLMSEKVDPNDLGIKPVIGTNFNTDLIKPDEQRDMVHRILTNRRRIYESGDYCVSSWKWEVDNTGIMNNGTINTYISGKPATVGSGNNSLETKGITSLGTSSTDSVTKGFQFRKVRFIGYEYGDPEDHNTPVLNQKSIHDCVFTKARQKRLVLKMSKANFGLQRGTLVNVVIFETSEVGKRQMWQNMMNLSGDKTANPLPSSEKMEKFFEDNTAELLNASVSGMYYIDGMSFEYDIDNKDNELIQRIFLIKKGNEFDYVNTNAVSKTYMAS